LNPSSPSTLLPDLPRGAEVLIVRLRSLGDVVLTTPALSALHAWRPDLRLCVLVEPFCAPLLEGNLAVAEVLIARKFLPTARALRKRRFPIAFNQHAGPTSALLTRFSGAPVRVCWDKRQFSFLYNVLVPEPVPVDGRPMMRTVEHRMLQFLWTGLPQGPIPPAAVYPQPGALASVEEKLAEKGIAPGEPYVVLRPGGKYFTKRWAVEKFAAIAKWLRESYGLAIVVNLGPGERDIASEVERHLAPVSVVLDGLDLRELIALLAGAHLFVGNDSGPTHIAAALRRPSVVIFGSSSSVYWRPWGTEHRIVQNDFPCNPCPEDRCYAFDEPLCILSVTLDQVREACAALLAAQGAPGNPSTLVQLKSGR
jgi:heptosyltransferase-3